MFQIPFLSSAYRLSVMAKPLKEEKIFTEPTIQEKVELENMFLTVSYEILTKVFKNLSAL